MRRSLRVLVALVGLGCGASAQQDDTAGRTWTETKCVRYAQAWTQLLQRKGRAGLSTSFVERHDAFIAAGCLSPPDVCPRSREEFEAANMLTVLAMNAGTASTFLPFACRPETRGGPDPRGGSNGR